MATLDELANRVADESGLPANAAAGKAQSYILEAYADVVQRARLNPATKLVSLVADQSDYTLSALLIKDLVMLRDVRYFPQSGGAGDSLEQVSPLDARTELARFTTVNGFTRRYALAGQTLILAPAPGSSSDQLYLDYDAAPGEFAPDESPPLLPLHLHDVLVWGGLTRDTEVHDIQRKAYYRSVYEKELGRVVRWASRRQGQRPRTARLGAHIRSAFDNDVYVRDC